MLSTIVDTSFKHITLNVSAVDSNLKPLYLASQCYLENTITGKV